MPSRYSIAIILSFLLIGLGQMYLGHVRRGILILVGGVLLGITVGWWLGWYGAIFGLAFWVWNIYDAYKLGNKEERATATTAKPKETFDKGW